MWRSIALALISLSFLPSASLADESKPADKTYHSPDYFHLNGRFADFLPHARRFLKDHPEDHRGPQIAMDMLMVAATLSDKDAIQESQRRLIFQFRRSLQADYLVRTTNSKELAELFKSTFNDQKNPLTEKSLKSFYAALENAYSIHGPNLADQELWAQGALAAPGLERAAACRAQIKQLDSDVAKLLDIALSEQLTAREKFVKLQKLKDCKSASAWQTFLYTQVLSEEDQADASVKKVHIESLLGQHEFARALEVMKTAPNIDADPQLLFCRGWAEAATGKTPEAIKTLEQVTKAHAKSAWSKPANELATALSGLPSNLSDHLAGLEEVIGDLRNHLPEVLELDLEWRPEPEQEEAVQAHLGLDFIADDIDLLMKRAGKPLLGYTTSKLGLSFFCNDEDRIHHFTDKGACYWLYLGVTPQADGAYYYGANFNTSPAPGGLRNGIQTLIQSPALITKAAREKFVRHFVKKGIFPAKVEPVGKRGERSFRWLIPHADKPAMDAFEIRLTADGKLASVAFSDVGRIDNIRYGSSDKVALVEQKWPDLPIVEGKEMGAPEMFKLLGAASKLFYPTKDTTPKTAAEPQPIRR